MQIAENTTPPLFNDTSERPTSTLADCIEACVACELACVACADACLDEGDIEKLRRCIRANQDCTDVCGATARLLSRFVERDGELLYAQLEACMRACVICSVECDAHAKEHEHCQVCAEACRRCEAACRAIVRSLDTTSV